MNFLIKILIVIAVFAFIGFGLFPHWVSRESDNNHHITVKNEGRFFVLSTPKEENTHIDYPRLIVEWVLILVPLLVMLLFYHTGRSSGGNLPIDTEDSPDIKPGKSSIDI